MGVRRRHFGNYDFGGYCGLHRKQDPGWVSWDEPIFLGDEERDEDNPAVHDMEREAVQDIARLMLTWAARLGHDSQVAWGLESGSAHFLELAERLL